MPHPNVYKTSCPNDHPYSEENTYVHRGKRSCKTCRTDAVRRKRAQGLAPEDERHGTLTGYANFNCRCSRCKSAYSDTSGVRNARRKYGLSKSEYADLKTRFEKSGCALCGSPQTMQIDHCHDTGRVRGVLCARCNSGLGKFKDDPGRLRKAARYLVSGKLEGEDFEGDIT